MAADTSNLTSNGGSNSENLVYMVCSKAHVMKNFSSTLFESREDKCSARQKEALMSMMGKCSYVLQMVHLAPIILINTSF